jgi:hypothetical protein
MRTAVVIRRSDLIMLVSAVAGVGERHLAAVGMIRANYRPRRAIGGGGWMQVPLAKG